HTREFAAAQSGNEGVGVDEAAAAGVHQDGVVPHLGNGFGVDEVVGFGGQRAVQADEVRRPQQLVQLHVAHDAFQVGVVVLVVGQHRHAVAVADAGHGG